MYRRRVAVVLLACVLIMVTLSIVIFVLAQQRKDVEPSPLPASQAYHLNDLPSPGTLEHTEEGRKVIPGSAKAETNDAPITITGIVQDESGQFVRDVGVFLVAERNPLRGPAMLRYEEYQGGICQTDQNGQFHFEVNAIEQVMIGLMPSAAYSAVFPKGLEPIIPPQKELVLVVRPRAVSTLSVRVFEASQGEFLNAFLLAVQFERSDGSSFHETGGPTEGVAEFNIPTDDPIRASAGNRELTVLA